MAQKRRRVKHILTFEERLAEEARRFKEAAEKETPGSMARELLLMRARRATNYSKQGGNFVSCRSLPANAVQDEATHALADMARDSVRGATNGNGAQHLVIEVRFHD